MLQRYLRCFSSFQIMDEKIQNPRENANLFSKCTFSWFIPTIIKGYNKELCEDDLFKILEDDQSSYLGDLLEKEWQKEKIKNNPSLWRAIINIFGKTFLLYSIISIATELVFKTSQCLSFIYLMEYFSQHTMDKNAFIYAGTLTFSSLAIIIGQHQSMYNYRLLGMRVRVACSSLIYRKSLRISKSIEGGINVGRVVNLITNDVNRFDYFIPLVNNLWLCPIQIVIVLIILSCITGWTGIIGVIIFIFIIPIHGKKLTILRRNTAKITDDRIKIMNEIITGIKTLKMLAWENPFSTILKQIRKEEIKYLRSTSLFMATLMTFMHVLPKLALFSSILTNYFMGNFLTPNYIFGLVVSYNMLKLPLNKFFPQTLFRWGESIVSVKRIEEFLQIDEITKFQPSKLIQETPKIQLKNIYSKGINKRTILNDISLNIIKSELIGIIGNTGSGKSTLLHLILKETLLTDGEININGVISYSSQEPWIFKGTIRENILFGDPYNSERYKTIIKICALEKDLSILYNGDQYILKENGSNLSGGQKARINLARAVYKNVDIYILDDPLSSVDAPVAEFIFKECIMSFLKNKCVILVLSQLKFLNYLNSIYVLNNGKLITSNNHSLQLYKFLKSDNNTDYQKCMNIKERNNEFYRKWTDEEEIKEDRQTGLVKFHIYKKYFKSGLKLYACLLLFLLAILFISSGAVFDAGFGYWSNIDQFTNSTSTKSLTREEYLLALSGLMFLIIITSITCITSYYLVFVKCSENLHNTIFDKVISAPLSFFHLNPSGRILNRFSKDLGLVDDYLHTVSIDTILLALTVVGVFIIKGFVNYWFCVIMVILTILLYFISKIYLPVIVAIKRLEGVTKSPVYTHIKTTIEGLVTIRAFKKETSYKNTFDGLQDIHTSAWFMYLSSVFTYRFLIDIIVFLLATIITFSFFFIEGIQPGTIGLVITQSMTLMTMAQWCVRQSCEVNVTMTSVERLTEYLDLKSEDGPIKEMIIKSTWPENGNINFNDVFLTYEPSKKFVLKNINLEIKSGQKVAIVGRTGAGKSSLCSALLQLTKTDDCITIDDVNIQHIPLKRLRSKISVIPQEPTLFSGTIRINLDPFQELTDADLWKALHEVRLKDFFTNFPDGLNTKISNHNLSIGQRQLICLARATLKKNKILIMDEATSNVDWEVEYLINQTIKHIFRDSTVLIITHKLNTILNCDLVLVLDDGEIVEQGNPQVLLRKKGIFFEMMEKINYKI